MVYIYLLIQAILTRNHYAWTSVVNEGFFVSTLLDFPLSTAHAKEQGHLVMITDCLVTCGQFSVN